MAAKPMKLHLPDYSQTHVLVAGDIMLDRYWSGNTQRISPEAPVPVVKVNELDERPGGAGNVGLNISSLGAQATVIGLCGQDEAGNTLSNKLNGHPGIQAKLHTIENHPTITKLRVLSRHQQLIRLDFEYTFTKEHSRKLVPLFAQQLQQVQAVILSDYAKGSLSVIGEFIDAANALNIPVLIDPKNPDFSLYRRASLVTPNLNEFEAAVGRCQDEQQIVERGHQLMKQHQLGALLITRSEQGMTLLQNGQTALHIPAINREVYDVTGAGDTVIAVLATSLAAGAPVSEAAHLANISAGIVVSKLGAATATVPELRRAVHDLHSAEQDVLEAEELLTFVNDARAHGETIVMTNGCFDILHAGHVSYLEEASKLGDRLIVAVNDDASVARLKGKDRPIIPLAHRMKVLAGLTAVDWVVAFSEDTPEALVCKVEPDILVKGGDYRPSEIAGNQCAGDTRVLEFMPGLSTSHIINAINKQDS